MATAPSRRPAGTNPDPADGADTGGTGSWTNGSKAGSEADFGRWTILDEAPVDAFGGAAARSDAGAPRSRAGRRAGRPPAAGFSRSARADESGRASPPGSSQDGNDGSWTDGTVVRIVQFQIQTQFQIHVVPDAPGTTTVCEAPGNEGDAIGAAVGCGSAPGCPGSAAAGPAGACPLVCDVELELPAVDPDEALFVCTMTMLAPGLPIVIGMAMLTGWV